MTRPGTTAERKIRVLPAALANQIAAGEVVERPASAVKELVENAIDADATAIFVDLETGGQGLIRVVDDGVGMSRGDAELCAMRHATSKLGDLADLTRVLSLGFRGEALPSIASVSRFVLVSRAATDMTASKIVIQGGGEPDISETSAPIGTRVEVRDLFYNVPARLKFLKRPQTEFGYAKRTLSSLALGYPYVHFRLTHNGRVAFDYPATRRLEDRIFQVLGKTIARGLHRVQAEGTLSIEGMISEPEINRGNQAGITTFINGRLIRDRIVTHALISSYGDLLPSGRYPYGVIYLHLPAEEIDVNVHPTKAEVRFQEPGFVHQAITSACAQTLSATPWILIPRAPEPLPTRRTFTPLPLPYTTDRRLEPAPPSAPKPTAEPAASSDLLTRGTTTTGHALVEAGGALHIVHLGRAQARIVEAQLKASLTQETEVGRPLMFPVALELDATAHRVLNQHHARLSRLGIGVEPFGGTSWQVVSLPGILRDAEPARVVSAAANALAKPDVTDEALCDAISQIVVNTPSPDEADRIVQALWALGRPQPAVVLTLQPGDLPGGDTP